MICKPLFTIKTDLSLDLTNRVTANCKTRIHHHCLVKFCQQKNSCPSCNKAWPQEAKDKQLLPIGEDAAMEVDPADEANLRNTTKFKALEIIVSSTNALL